MYSHMFFRSFVDVKASLYHCIFFTLIVRWRWHSKYWYHISYKNYLMRILFNLKIITLILWLFSSRGTKYGSKLVRNKIFSLRDFSHSLSLVRKTSHELWLCLHKRSSVPVFIETRMRASWNTYLLTLQKIDNSSLLKFIEIQWTLINFNKFLINFNCLLSAGDNCDDHRYVFQES